MLDARKETLVQYECQDVIEVLFERWMNRGVTDYLDLLLPNVLYFTLKGGTMQIIRHMLELPLIWSGRLILTSRCLIWRGLLSISREVSLWIAPHLLAQAAALAEQQQSMVVDDPLKDKYGDLPLVQSQTQSGRKWTQIEDLTSSLENQQVLISSSVSNLSWSPTSSLIGSLLIFSAMNVWTWLLF